jgi:hypothetical protein
VKDISVDDLGALSRRLVELHLHDTDGTALLILAVLVALAHAHLGKKSLGLFGIMGLQLVL